MILNNFDSPSKQTNWLNVQILNRVRFIAIIGQVTLILFAVWYLQIDLSLVWLFGIVIFEILFQLYSLRHVKQVQLISQHEIFLHILIDSLILAALVYFSGGANNPFIYLLLVSIALGTFMLSSHYLLVVTVTQLSLYSLLNIYQKPLQLVDSSPLASFHLHLLGMWVNFVLIVLLIAVFGLLARHSLLKQEKQLQEFREKQLKDEQILSLGIMSASAAHELGTPLATMAIIVDDLKHEENTSQRIQKDMELLASQIDACRNIIQGLNEKSSRTRKQQTKPVGCLKLQLQSIIERWLVYRPQIELIQNWANNFETINHELSISVEQAVTNLMNNAADASLANNIQKIEVNCILQQRQLVIEIVDFGEGLTPKMRASLGANIHDSNKSDGLGWGLFLSNASIERIGGEVHLMETSTGGTLTRINLPMEQL